MITLLQTVIVIKKGTSVCVSWGLSCDSVEGDKEAGQVEVKMSLLL